jgi:ABC-2 type transport system permease protein
LLGDRDVDDQLEAALRQAWATAALSAELQDRGLSAEEVDQLVGAEPPGVQLLDPPNVERDRRVGFAAVAGIVLYLQLLGFGYWVAMSIVEEKTSQVIEILLAKVRPRTLLAGKAAGIGVLGLGQLVLYIAVGLAAFTLADRYPIPPGVWPLVPVVVIAYVLGYLTYAAVMAIAGALSARVEDLQTRTMPFTLVLTASYIGTIIAADEPDGTLARWLSLLPVSSPLVMPMRIAHGSVAAWEVALSVAIALATALLLLRLADRVYRAGALRLRRTTKLRAALREAA